MLSKDGEQDSPKDVPHTSPKVQNALGSSLNISSERRTFTHTNSNSMPHSPPVMTNLAIPVGLPPRHPAPSTQPPFARHSQLLANLPNSAALSRSSSYNSAVNGYVGSPASSSLSADTHANRGPPNNECAATDVPDRLALSVTSHLSSGPGQSAAPVSPRHSPPHSPSPSPSRSPTGSAAGLGAARRRSYALLSPATLTLTPFVSASPAIAASDAALPQGAAPGPAPVLTKRTHTHAHTHMHTQARTQTRTRTPTAISTTPAPTITVTNPPTHAAAHTAGSSHADATSQGPVAGSQGSASGSTSGGGSAPPAATGTALWHNMSLSLSRTSRSSAAADGDGSKRVSVHKSRTDGSRPPEDPATSTRHLHNRSWGAMGSTSGARVSRATQDAGLTVRARSYHSLPVDEDVAVETFGPPTRSQPYAPRPSTATRVSNVAPAADSTRAGTHGSALSRTSLPSQLAPPVAATRVLHEHTRTHSLSGAVGDVVDGTEPASRGVPTRQGTDKPRAQNKRRREYKGDLFHVGPREIRVLPAWLPRSPSQLSLSHSHSYSHIPGSGPSHGHEHGHGAGHGCVPLAASCSFPFQTSSLAASASCSHLSLASSRAGHHTHLHAASQGLLSAQSASASPLSPLSTLSPVSPLSTLSTLPEDTSHTPTQPPLVSANTHATAPANHPHPAHAPPPASGAPSAPAALTAGSIVRVPAAALLVAASAPLSRATLQSFTRQSITVATPVPVSTATSAPATLSTPFPAPGAGAASTSAAVTAAVTTSVAVPDGESTAESIGSRPPAHPASHSLAAVPTTSVPTVPATSAAVGAWGARTAASMDPAVLASPAPSRSLGLSTSVSAAPSDHGRTATLGYMRVGASGYPHMATGGYAAAPALPRWDPAAVADFLSALPLAPPREVLACMPTADVMSVTDSVDAAECVSGVCGDAMPVAPLLTSAALERERCPACERECGSALHVCTCVRDTTLTAVLPITTDTTVNTTAITAATTATAAAPVGAAPDTATSSVTTTSATATSSASTNAALPSTATSAAASAATTTSSSPSPPLGLSDSSPSPLPLPRPSPSSPYSSSSPPSSSSYTPFTSTAPLSIPSPPLRLAAVPAVAHALAHAAPNSSLARAYLPFLSLHRPGDSLPSAVASSSPLDIAAQISTVTVRAGPCPHCPHLPVYRRPLPLTHWSMRKLCGATHTSPTSTSCPSTCAQTPQDTSAVDAGGACACGAEMTFIPPQLVMRRFARQLAAFLSSSEVPHWQLHWRRVWSETLCKWLLGAGDAGEDLNEALEEADLGLAEGAREELAEEMAEEVHREVEHILQRHEDDSRSPSPAHSATTLSSATDTATHSRTDSRSRSPRRQHRSHRRRTRSDEPARATGDSSDDSADAGEHRALRKRERPRRNDRDRDRDRERLSRRGTREPLSRSPSSSSRSSRAASDGDARNSGRDVARVCKHQCTYCSLPRRGSAAMRAGVRYEDELNARESYPEGAFPDISPGLRSSVLAESLAVSPDASTHASPVTQRESQQMHAAVPHTRTSPSLPRTHSAPSPTHLPLHRATSTVESPRHARQPTKVFPPPLQPPQAQQSSPPESPRMAPQVAAPLLSAVEARTKGDLSKDGVTLHFVLPAYRRRVRRAREECDSASDTAEPSSRPRTGLPSAAATPVCACVNYVCRHCGDTVADEALRSQHSHTRQPRSARSGGAREEASSLASPPKERFRSRSSSLAASSRSVSPDAASAAGTASDTDVATDADEETWTERARVEEYQFDAVVSDLEWRWILYHYLDAIEIPAEPSLPMSTETVEGNAQGVVHTTSTSTSTSNSNSNSSGPAGTTASPVAASLAAAGPRSLPSLPSPLPQPQPLQNTAAQERQLAVFLQWLREVQAVVVVDDISRASARVLHDVGDDAAAVVDIGQVTSDARVDGAACALVEASLADETVHRDVPGVTAQRTTMTPGTRTGELAASPPIPTRVPNGAVADCVGDAEVTVFYRAAVSARCTVHDMPVFDLDAKVRAFLAVVFDSTTGVSGASCGSPSLARDRSLGLPATLTPSTSPSPSPLLPSSSLFANGLPPAAAFVHPLPAIRGQGAGLHRALTSRARAHTLSERGVATAAADIPTSRLSARARLSTTFDGTTSSLLATSVVTNQNDDEDDDSVGGDNVGVHPLSRQSRWLGPRVRADVPSLASFASLASSDEIDASLTLGASPAAPATPITSIATGSPAVPAAPGASSAPAASGVTLRAYAGAPQDSTNVHAQPMLDGRVSLLPPILPRPMLSSTDTPTDTASAPLGSLPRSSPLQSSPLRLAGGPVLSSEVTPTTAPLRPLRLRPAQSTAHSGAHSLMAPQVHDGLVAAPTHLPPPTLRSHTWRQRSVSSAGSTCGTPGSIFSPRVCVPAIEPFPERQLLSPVGERGEDADSDAAADVAVDMDVLSVHATREVGDTGGPEPHTNAYSAHERTAAHVAIAVNATAAPEETEMSAPEWSSRSAALAHTYSTDTYRTPTLPRMLRQRSGYSGLGSSSNSNSNAPAALWLLLSKRAALALNVRFRRRVGTWLSLPLDALAVRLARLQLLQVGRACAVEYVTVATAWVYLDRLILRNMVDQRSIRLVAAVCLLLALKYQEGLTYDKGEFMDLVYSQVRAVLGVERTSLFSLELSVFVALEMNMDVPLYTLLPHLLKVYYSLHGTLPTLAQLRDYTWAVLGRTKRVSAVSAHDDIDDYPGTSMHPRSYGSVSSLF